jgi:error-prone DNA polymerase
MRYEHYFLTVYDIVRFARSSTSCARAAARPPIRRCATASASPRSTRRGQPAVRALHLAERNEPPDIDVDFEHQRREEVIQYIYKSTAAPRRAGGGGDQLPPKSALRDSGKALGIDLAIVEKVCQAAPLVRQQGRGC